ncbi:MAG: VPLPA-CTERM sorting domain-containing protein [Gammaproteobacteria bacterium]
MLHKNFCKNSLTVLALATAIAYAPVSSAALSSYSQNWESYAGTWNTDAAAISADGYVIGNINVSTGGAWFDNVAAPNNAADGLNGYSSLVSGEGGTAQGDVQLSIFSDYNSWSPFTTPGTTLQTFTYRDNGTIGADDVGKTYRFSFDGKDGGVTADPASEAWGFVKVLKQSDGSYFELVNNTFDSTTFTTDWSGGFAEFTVDAGMVGELVQFGFANQATDWGPSGVFYDNLSFADTSAVPVPAAVWLFGSGLLGLVGVARRKRMS